VEWGSSMGRAGRMRDKDAGSGNSRPIDATEDAGSRRSSAFQRLSSYFAKPS